MNAQDTHGRLDVLAFRLFEKAAKSDPIASALAPVCSAASAAKR